MKTINYLELLNEILKTEQYNSWEQQGSRDDWRDPEYKKYHKNVSPISLSRTGLTDFSTTPVTHIPLIEVAIRQGILKRDRPANFKTRKAVSLVSTSPKNNLKKNKQTQLARYIYHQSTITPRDIGMIQKYFNNRGISISVELIAKIGFRINRYEGQTYIVVPYRNFRGVICMVEKIQLSGDLKSSGKIKNGAASENCAIVINSTFEKGVILESVTDAVAFLEHVDPNVRVVVSGGTSGFGRIKAFVKAGDTLIVDPDEENQLYESSLVIETDVVRMTPTLGDGVDCAKAVELGFVDRWVKSLKEL